MLIDYLPIVVMAVLATVFAVGSLAASAMLRPRRPNPVKLSAYECGNDPVRLPRGERFSVKFYLTAMLFIIFDIEAIFLFPWAVQFRALGVFGLVEMAVFIGAGLRRVRVHLAQGRVRVVGGDTRRAGGRRRARARTAPARGGPCRLSASRACTWARRPKRSRKRSSAASC